MSYKCFPLPLFKKKFLFLLFTLSFLVLFYDSAHSQNTLGEIHGNFETIAQYYNPDSAIGAPTVPEKMLMNGFTNINYTYGNTFSAGIRYESYLNVLQGFDSRYKGTGIPYRYATYKIEELEITAGSYYEQFGSGLIFRSYEERGLGYDNAMDGFRIKASPTKGLYLKGIVGKQRFFFSQGAGIVRGFDGEAQVNDLFKKFNESKTKVSVGGSFVSKYQTDQDPTFVLPENVGAWSARANLIRGDFNLGGEYTYKINDPSTANSYIYKSGEALLITSGYSTKGFGINLSAKRIDNMNFRSDRTATLNTLLINYLPALTKQHTYGLLTFYPYASQPNGEISFQAEMIYKIKKDSKLGGPYGTEITINYSGANSIDKVKLYDDNGARKNYTSDFLKIGKEIYFRDFVFEANRKFNKKTKATFVYANQIYNGSVIRQPGFPTVYSNIEIVDVTYKVKSDKAIRVELQNLSTNQDMQSWAQGLVEYSHGEHWFLAALDQYNYGNDDTSKRFHYVNASVGYIKNANRITLSYGKQRAGIFCVGGVCRTVPASNGITLSITSSF